MFLRGFAFGTIVMHIVNHESTKDDNTKKKRGRTKGFHLLQLALIPSGLAGFFASWWLRRHFSKKSLFPVEKSCILVHFPRIFNIYYPIIWQGMPLVIV